jgi:predicted transcriptional regulator
VNLAWQDLSEPEKFIIARRRLGATQEDIGRLAGMSRIYVTRWEAGSLDLSEERIALLWHAIATLDNEQVRAGRAAGGAA